MNNDTNKDIDIFFALGVLANILQVANYEQNLIQTSNDDIMKALDVQTKTILDRIESKLDKILENQARGGIK